MLIGFDSAWMDNPAAPGAIAAVELSPAGPAAQVVAFHPPRPVGYAAALAFIAAVRRDGLTLIAIDQPTLVPNPTGMRPAERVAAALISWLGGGVQPANQGRTSMFCAAAPIWRFLSALAAIDNPPAARTATTGLYVMEVFPALALATLVDDACARLAAARYNPARRRTFRPADWLRVTDAAARHADSFGAASMADWCRHTAHATPTKSAQDQLDAVLCVLIALHWRLRPREASIMIGDLTHGYIVAPASPAVRARLIDAARRRSVPIDGEIVT